MAEEGKPGAHIRAAAEEDGLAKVLPEVVIGDSQAATAESEAEKEKAADAEKKTGATEGKAVEKQPVNEPAKRLSLPIAIGIAVAALVVGLLVGMFLLGGAGGSALSGKTTVAEGALDSIMASYSCQGQEGSVTVREVIEQSTSLEAAKDADGNYKVPTADTAMGVVRNKLLVAEAERQGITVTDADVAAYAVANLGTDKYEEIAASYKMDVDAVKVLVRDSCLLGKLRETVAPTYDADMPEPPAEPKSTDGEASSASTKEYADYIIALAGDEWDAKKGAWASKDGPYASGLSGAYEITADGATYEAASAAYYIAYQQYAQEAAAAGDKWTDYVNSILSNASIQLNTLLA